MGCNAVSEKGVVVPSRRQVRRNRLGLTKGLMRPVVVGAARREGTVSSLVFTVDDADLGLCRRKGRISRAGGLSPLKVVRAMGAVFSESMSLSLAVLS